jgi:hypothetical protein
MRPGRAWFARVFLAMGAMLLATLAIAQTEAARDYDIPGGPLSSALAQFGAQAGVLLSIDAKLTEGMSVPALKGRYTVRDGLHRLLIGSGLEAVGDARTGYTLRQSAPGASSATDSILVKGKGAIGAITLPDLAAPTVTVTARRDYDIGPMGLQLQRR